MTIGSPASFLFSRRARPMGLAVACLGSLLLAAHLIDAVRATGRSSNPTTMNPTTALAFVFSGLSLYLLAPTQSTSVRRRFGSIGAACAGLLGGFSLGMIDARDSVPFRVIEAANAVNFILIGIALWWLRKGQGAVTQILTLAAMGCSSVALVGRFYGVAEPLESAFGPAMILPAILFFVLGLGILSVNPERGVLSIVTSDHAGARMARRVLPAAVVLPLLIGWLRLEGQRAGLYDVEFGLTLFALANVVCFSALVLGAAASLRRTDAQREQAQGALFESESRFRLLADALPQIVWATDMSGKSTYLNRRWAEYTGLEEAEPEATMQVIHPDDLVPMNEIWQQARSAGVDYQAEFRLRPASGGFYRWFLARAAAVRGPDGEIREWFGTSTDIDDLKRTQDALRESEARFHRTFDGMLEGCQIIGFDWRYLYVNDSVTVHARQTREQLVGRTMMEVYPGIETTEVFAVLRRCMEERTTHRIENRFRYPDGHEAWFDLSIQPGPEGIFVLSADVTSRKEAEQSLKKLANLIEHSRDFIALADLDGRVTFMNGAARRMIGLNEDEDISALYFTAYVPNEWQDFFRDTVVRTAREQGNWEGEMQLCNMRTGERLEVYRSTFLIRNESGRPDCYATVTRDVTEQKRAVEAMRESESRFHQLADSIPQLAWMAEPDGSLFWYNQRWYDYTGTTFEEMKGWGWKSVHEPAEIPRVLARFERALVTGEPWEDTFPLRRRDGVMRWHLSRANPIRNDRGEVVRWFGTNTDITEQRELAEALQQSRAQLEDRVAERTAQLEAANKELEAFSYSVSHDLRAPLRAIDGFSRIMEDEYSAQLSADAREFLHDIRANTKQMGRLVDDLLAFSRLSRKPIAKQTVAVVELVKECLGELRPMTADRKIDVRIGELPDCRADRSLLKQVWLNLLGNALKYSAKREPATIEIDSSSGTEGIVYFIRDNGAGFDMRYADKLFGVFQRLHRAEDYEGTGVGLAIVQRVIHRHGGRVWAEGKLEGGATFYFTLP